jgi:alpha-methylacyl-CoA racemase
MLALTSGHDINYISLTGALHAIGTQDGPPQIPLNLVGDFGGGGAYLAIGVLAALRDADRTGEGQVVDAAIVDGVSHLLASTHMAMAAGAWEDERGRNLLDGGAPFYGVYETSDGKYMAVGALEPKFYAELLAKLGLDEPLDHQNNQHTWPHLRKRLVEIFLTKSQQEWTDHFAGSDACVSPALSLKDAPHHPHVAGRGSLVEVGGVLQAAPAPRFSKAPSSVQWPPPRPGEHSAQILADFGFANATDLFNSGVAVGPCD